MSDDYEGMSGKTVYVLKRRIAELEQALEAEKKTFERLRNQLQQKVHRMERHNELLLTLIDDHKILLEQVMNWRIGIMGLAGYVYSGKLSKKRIDEMYDAVAAIDAGALGE